jgi:hypothetical protein
LAPGKVLHTGAGPTPHPTKTKEKSSNRAHVTHVTTKTKEKPSNRAHVTHVTTKVSLTGIEVIIKSQVFIRYC